MPIGSRRLRLARSWWHRWFAALAYAACCRAAMGEAKVKGRKTLLWPIHLQKVPMSSGTASLEPPEFGKELADIGAKGFRRYLKTILPTELEKDLDFAANFNVADHSRVNLAFRRWQARAFASREGIPVRRVLLAGETSPKVENVSYSWPELYEGPQFKRLLGRIRQLSKVYLKRSGYGPEDLKQKFLVFPWVEVFGFGEALRPMTRTDGAYVFARYFASVERGALKFNFEDPRGINPPYGKTHSEAVYNGEVAMLPSWVSTFITPNMRNTTAVCYCFLVYPEKGRLRWENDKTGNIKLYNEFEIGKGRK